MSEASGNAATREEVAFLAKRAGLDLSPEHLDDLVEAYRRLEPMLEALRRDRDPSIEPACGFDPRRFMPGAEAETPSGEW